ncbi:type VII secretion protein EccB [Labedaea rhizosphaerae]|uniref:Type VII secretion protein EccB n=1 Tax=Labedaea rhizosphaerae TaxID=598644 RepID=A0A4V3CYQ4_LABRH|nr:type VII secretion protein EccB [Labedaea rhizosphaerae]TDP95058.1 type VII secretion protein EccB [Labedaea rhizosphaerae]
MWTQRDQIQAYQFLRRRLVSALVAADANHPTSPSKRLVLGVVLGLAGTLLAAAVFGVIGLLTPSRAQEWRQGGQVIVEQETGALFILGADDALHPVLNYASARLLAGGDGTKTVVVPAKSLRDVPRGEGVGLAGAPASLPQPDRLVSGPWTRCSRTSPDRPAGAPPISTVLLGQDPAGSVLRDGQGLLARLDGDRQYLITGGHRYKLADKATVTALGYDSADVLTVSPEWLNTVPAGRDLGTIDVPQAGAQGPAVGGQATRIGQVLTTGGGYYLVRPDGLAVVTETEARLALGAAHAGAAYPGRVPEPLPVAAADVAAAPRSAAKSTGYPRFHPVTVTVDQSSVVCTTGTEVTVGHGTLALASPPILTDPKAKAATEVSVPGGMGAVVESQPTPGAASGTVYVITDTGKKYPVVDEKALAALGYGGAPKVGVSPDVLALFPTGVTLDPNAAARTVPT